MTVGQRRLVDRIPPWLAAVVGVGLVAVIGAAAAAGNPVATSPFERQFTPGFSSRTPEPGIDPNGRGLSDTGGWLGYVIGGLVLLALLVLVVTIVVLTIRMFSGRHNGLLRRRVLEPEELELLVTPLADVDLLGRGEPVADAVQDGLIAVVSGHDARTAIISAWLRLEGAATQVGTPRRDTDAPGDLVQRLLAGHAVHPTRLEELAELYRRARFSHTPLDEVDRAAAVRALSAVRGDLLGEPVETGGTRPDGGRWPTRWN
jgi:hypothetical protein